MYCLHLLALMLALSSAAMMASAAEAPNLCPNPGAEEGGGPEGPAGWFVEGGKGIWAEDFAHSGKRSFKLINTNPATTIGWCSPMIPAPEAGAQLLVSVWVRMEQVSGNNGACIVLYHTDEKGQRIGDSGFMCFGGAGATVATEEWKQYTVVSNLTPKDKGLRVNLRLYGATGSIWFDDISVQSYTQKALTKPRALRRGLRLGQAAIVLAQGAEDAAATLQRALRARGIEAPILADDKVNLREEKRDLIVFGNLATSRAAEVLYCNSYTLEDLYFPGKGGYALRPLIDPLGTGANLLVVGYADAAGLAAGTAALLEKVKGAAETLDISLTVKTGEGYKGLGSYPWAGSGPRYEMVPAAEYLKTGDLKFAREYRDVMLKQARKSDAQLFSEDASLHLVYVTQTQSWDLMDACGVFSDAERLEIENYLLKVLRSGQGYGFSGLSEGMFSRENHGTRAARAFYYGWRHFNKYYAADLGAETELWRRKLQGFWAACFASSRSFEDSLSQHALGGSMDNTLDIAFMEPAWSAEFFASGRAHRMGERCIAISNNMGQTVLLGDTQAGDYASGVFSKLAYRLGDGRYTFMIGKREGLGTSVDEPMRGFNAGVQPRVPQDHIGLTIIPADDLFFHTALRNTAGVPFAAAFDKLTFRSGFDPQDEYLMLDGTAGGSHSYDDVNTIGEFSANSRRWLCEVDIFNGPTLSFHNAVTVARDGLGDPNVPQAAELVDSARGEGYAYTATRLPHYGGAAWTRHTLWMPGRQTFVLDEVTADDPGDYSFVLGWRSVGKPTLQPGQFEAAQDEEHRPGSTLTGGALDKAVTQSSGKFHYHLSDYDALLFRADQVGDYFEAACQVPAAGEYDISVSTLDYTGRGVMQVSLDGKPLGGPLDLFFDGPPKSTDRRLGTGRLEKGAHTARFTVVGKNELSKGYFVAISGLSLVPAGSKPQPTVEPNRFRLAFPADVPATLDRDTETLGQYLPLSPHYDPALNIVEQSMHRALKSGEAACFQNVFCATAGPQLRTLELRRLNDHTALLKSGDEIALVGCGVSGASANLGALEASGKLFYLSASRVILRQATASLDGKALSGEAGAGGEALGKALRAAWEGAAGSGEGRGTAWEGLPALRTRWSADLGDRPLALAVCKGPTGMRVAAGTASGLVQQWDRAGAAAGEFKTGGPVHALDACDLDGDGAQELLAGSDDEHLYALDGALKPLWSRQIPFLADEQPWGWWTLGTAKVRKIHADDINGDGKPELLLGVGNMRLHCLDNTGKELWRFRTDHGTCTTIITADPFREGKRRVLAGNGLSSDQGLCWVLDESGKVLSSFYNDGWCTSLPAIAVGDLAGEGKNTVLCGNNRGNLRAYAAELKSAEPLWIRNLTRPIRSLTIVPRGKGSVVAVGSDSGYLCAFDQAGQKVWGMALSSAISHTVLLRWAGAAPVVAAGCKDGEVFLVTAEGRLVGRFDCKGRLEDMIAADLEGDGTDELVVATSGANRVMVVGRP